MVREDYNKALRLTLETIAKQALLTRDLELIKLAFGLDGILAFAPVASVG
ncbi:hypothetical protein [Candidatus Nitrososphaera gargensis]|nr:hypothetical protein [Candidatus Nitrososphaera gargensis]